jgi:hypothetical protein
MLQGFEAAVRDIKEWSRDFPLADYRELNVILIEKFGKGLEYDSKKTIASIVKRGKLRNEDEYRLIDDAVNELCQTNHQSSEIETFNKMLLEFHNKTSTRISKK